MRYFDKSEIIFFCCVFFHGDFRNVQVSFKTGMKTNLEIPKFLAKIFILSTAVVYIDGFIFCQSSIA